MKFQNKVGKFFLTSTTIWGGIFTIVFSAISAYGIDVPKEMQDSIRGVVFQFLNHESSLLALGGGLLAIIGRFIATEPITLKPKPKK